MRATSVTGVEVNWYRWLADVPQSYALYIAHEFFDALPVYKFQKKDGTWHEVLVDVEQTSDPDVSRFRYVLSPAATAASTLLQHMPAIAKEKDHLEICPEAGVIAQEMANRISSNGGSALIVDYGHSGEKTDTLRAFRSHAVTDPLEDPGTCDLTADVDFGYLRHVIGDQVSTLGPIAQNEFLYNMGIAVRLKVLLSKADPKAAKDLLTGYDMLMNPDKMGKRFKFFALRQKNSSQSAGFTPLS